MESRHRNHDRERDRRERERNRRDRDRIRDKEQRFVIDIEKNHVIIILVPVFHPIKGIINYIIH